MMKTPLALAVLAPLLCSFGLQPAAAQPLLTCGASVLRFLDPGAVDAYRVLLTAGSTVSVDVRDVTGVLGLIRLRASGPGGTQETCTGTIMVSAPGETVIEVSDCLGSEGGDYTLTASVVAATADNCGIPLPCGTLPSFFALARPGEVDTFTFDGSAGDQVTLKAIDLDGTIGFIRQRLFDPNGVPVNGADSCAGSTPQMQLQKTGRHTLLVSACGLPKTGAYSLTAERSSCPTGPQITYFGIARPDGRPVPPSSFDEQGRAAFSLKVGSGFFVVLEAHPGSRLASVGFNAFDYDPDDPTVLPDLQMLLSQPLGNGSAEVCDKERGHQGGIPATVPLEFAETQEVADHVNDLGCRVNDGTGQPRGVSSNDACTQFIDGSSHFVDVNSTVQFCTPIAGAWRFASGSTIVHARARDRDGVLGPAREIAIMVDDEIRPCPSDCNRDSTVGIDEVVLAVSILMGQADVGFCLAADLNGDATVSVDEIIQGVAAALNGCPGGS